MLLQACKSDVAFCAVTEQAHQAQTVEAVQWGLNTAHDADLVFRPLAGQASNEELVGAVLHNGLHHVQV